MKVGHRLTILQFIKSLKDPTAPKVKRTEIKSFALDSNGAQPVSLNGVRQSSKLSFNSEAKKPTVEILKPSGSKFKLDAIENEEFENEFSSDSSKSQNRWENKRKQLQDRRTPSSNESDHQVHKRSLK